MAKNTTNTGVSCAFMLFVVFLILKLTDVIDWSWWWVTSPLWIGWALVLLIFVVILVLSLFEKD
jgi:phosphoglycerol transferase MdoB-like AlkP superfamily enzyme